MKITTEFNFETKDKMVIFLAASLFVYSTVKAVETEKVFWLILNIFVFLLMLGYGITCWIRDQLKLNDEPNKAI